MEIFGETRIIENNPEKNIIVQIKKERTKYMD